MIMPGMDNSEDSKRIEIQCDGPFKVYGSIPLVTKIQIVSEYGEPLSWKKGETLPAKGSYYELCRCGHSGKKPFCDGTHNEIDFDGTESADIRTTAERRVTYEGGTQIVVRRDHSLCMDSGFCGMRLTDIEKLVPATDDTQVRALVIAMIEHCPSGALTYSIEEDGADIEPDYPQQIAITTEITADGPIPGPLWVTGNIPVQRSDGRPLETRNRVTLCNCGLSKCKPLCDGSHRKEA
jgi:CDGSH-type Zn-finger protein